MSYRETLERLKKIQNSRGEEPPKLTEPGFGGFVGSPDGALQNSSAHAGKPDDGEETSKRTADGTAKTDKTVASLDPVTPCPACDCGSYWHAADGWHCESCNPAPEHVERWYTVPGGTVASTTAPSLPWPPEMTIELRRVSEHFEWSRRDIADFTRWARRSPQGLADACAFLRGEATKLRNRWE
jgi:hypothetical protein